MKKVLILAAAAEAVTGVGLFIVPALVGRLLLGEELAGPAVPVARVAGIALIVLGVACWRASPLVGMLIYNAVVTVYLSSIGISGDMTGILLTEELSSRTSILSVLLGRIWLVGAEPSSQVGDGMG